jgi:hypothetical protein
MEKLGYWGLFFGVVGTLLAIFITELIRTAFKTRLVAFKASAYLTSTLNALVDNKSFMDAAMIAKKWSDERAKVIQDFGRRKLTTEESNALTTLDKKYRDIFAEVFKDDKAVTKIMAGFVEFKKTPAALAEHQAQALRQENDLRNNVSWISDEDAAYLGWGAAHHTVTVRQKLMHVAACAGLLLAHARETTVNPKVVAPILESFFNALIDALRAFFPLREKVERVRKMNLIELILFKLND